MTKVCIVEDEIIIAKDLELSLKLNGYEVCSIVDNLDDAISSAVYYKPSSFIMDINLKRDIDGIQIAEHLLRIIKTNIIFHSSDSADVHF